MSVCVFPKRLIFKQWIQLTEKNLRRRNVFIRDQSVVVVAKCGEFVKVAWQERPFLKANKHCTWTNPTFSWENYPPCTDESHTRNQGEYLFARRDFSVAIPFRRCYRQWYSIWRWGPDVAWRVSIFFSVTPDRIDLNTVILQVFKVIQPLAVYEHGPSWAAHKIVASIRNLHPCWYSYYPILVWIWNTPKAIQPYPGNIGPVTACRWSTSWYNTGVIDFLDVGSQANPGPRSWEFLVTQWHSCHAGCYDNPLWKHVPDGWLSENCSFKRVLAYLESGLPLPFTVCFDPFFGLKEILSWEKLTPS